jgi:hypothetical protein
MVQQREIEAGKLLEVLLKKNEGQKAALDVLNIKK